MELNKEQALDALLETFFKEGFCYGFVKGFDRDTDIIIDDESTDGFIKSKEKFKSNIEKVKEKWN